MKKKRDRYLLIRGKCGPILAALLLSVFLCTTGHALTGLTVQDSQGNPIGSYRWLLEEDVTHHPDPTADHPVPDPNVLGTNLHKSYMPVVAAGNAASLGDAIAIVNANPSKYYFISVLPSDAGGDIAYTLGGGLIKPGLASLTVTVNTLPIPTAQISVYVFHDNAPINNTPDLPQEQGLAGFQVILEDPGGQYGVGAGQLIFDAYGNLLGTTYVTNPDGSYELVDGAPVVDVLGSGGVLTNENGIVVIKNLPPGKYGVIIDPPEGQGWVQTSTIEGSPVIDAWVKANEPPYFTEFGPAGHHVEFGFVKPFNNIPGGGSATISGQVRNIHMSRPPDYSFFNGHVFPDTWVGLNDMTGGVGTGIYAAKTVGNSNFSIPPVPEGTYQLVIWDDNLDVIFASRGITVNNAGQCLQQDGSYGSCDLGPVGVYNWFSALQGTVFWDDNQNGFPDPGDIGMDNQAVLLRWRDGTVYGMNSTNLAGEYEYAEVFPFFNWLVAEVDFARYKATGVTVVVDGGGPVPAHNGWTMPSYGRLNPQVQDQVNDFTGNALSRTETGEVLTQGFLGFLGQTSVIHWGKHEYGPGPDGQYGTADDENGGISGIVFYDVTRAEDDPRYNGGEVWQPGIPNVTVNLYGIDGRDENGKPNALTLINQTQTDSWDADPPTGCPGNPLDTFYMDGKCYDGLRNFNQVRPAVFDGGYAFTSYYPEGFGTGDEVEGLPTGNYVVEVVPAAPYKVVSSLDKNVDFGESYRASTLALPSVCVGATVTLPADATLNMFPGVEAPLAGQSFNECNMKEVIVQSARNAAADFFLFTEVPPAAHAVGFILNDWANEFDPNNPNFGEKFALPFVPISFRDFKGREITRVYSDQYGNYNALIPSTFTTNIPSPSGMSPSMLIACMNDPGPIEDPANPESFITDPYYQSQYTQFCYTFQYMPATTTYLDTPLQPIAAFAGANQEVLDCEFPDRTPIIRKAIGPVYNGPYVLIGDIIQITAMGNTQVPNPGGTPALVERDYGFGPDTEGRKVWIGDTELTVQSWTNGVISATIPEGTATGQLRITRGDNGLSTIMGLTVTVGPIGGTVRTVVPTGDQLATPISDAIFGATPGDLILVPEGTYYELVVMSKEVQLQGSGITTVINAAKTPGDKLQNWRNYIATLVTDNFVDLLPGQILDFDIQNNEPGLFNTTEGPGVMVLGQESGGVSEWNGNGRIDGFSIMGSDISGAIVVNGYTQGLEISNNRLISNGGLYGGGITAGLPLVAGDAVDGQNDGINIHHNHITQNGAMTAGSGGVSLFTGADGYAVADNYICGNFSSGTGGGIGHHGLSDGGLIARNRILFNQTFNQLVGSSTAGGGIAIENLPPLGGGLGTGTGSVTIDSNLIQGNLAGSSDGGGIYLAFVDGENAADPYPIRIINNMIVNNVTGLAGGGISIQDALDVSIVHNTITRNDSTATAADAFVGGGTSVSTPQPAGIVSRSHSTSLAGLVGAGFSNPVLLNNIIRHNRSFYWDVNAQIGELTGTPIGGLLPDPASPVFNDLAVLGIAGSLNPMSSILTDATGYDGSNMAIDPIFVQPYFNGNSLLTTIPEDTTPLATAAALDEGGNFIDVRFGPLTPVGNYHLLSGSPARNAGASIAGLGIAALNEDFDADVRDANSPDVGADEVGAAGAEDTVNIQSVTYDPTQQTLTVVATSSTQPNAALSVIAYVNGNPENLGNLDWKSWLEFYRNSFTGIPVRPSSILVTSSRGGSAVYDFPAADTVAISSAVYDGIARTLTVVATSSEQSDVSLTATGYGALGWKSWLNFYRSTFTNVDRPASVTVTSSGGGSATFNLPASDTVTIQSAVYSANNGGSLTVVATSSEQSDVSLTATGYGALGWKSWLSFYRTTFTGVGDKPANVTVTSSGGGSATIAVQ